jgi:hypothetical protein
MKKISIEIIQITGAILLTLAGLALTLTYLDGRLLVGLVLMISGIALWIVVLRRATCQK